MRGKGPQMLENPSAGKFEPPPGSQPVDPRSVKPSGGRLLSLGGLAVAFLWKSHLLLRIPFFFYRRTSGYATLGMAALALASYFASRRGTDKPAGGDTYSPPPNITR
jgi:hypothetical protein